MNILYISDLSGMGGGEVSLLHILRELKKTNNVYLLCRVDGKLVELTREEKIPVYCYDFKRNLAESLRKFKNIVRHNQIEIVHSNELTTAIIHGFFLWILRENAINVMTCHGQWYKLSFERKLLLNIFVRHIFCVSDAVFNNLKRQGVDRLTVSYLGVPTYTYKTNFVDTVNLKKELGIVENDIVIVTIARFQRIKAQMKGVVAIEELSKVLPNIKYYLVGDNIFGSLEDAQYKESVKTYIHDHDLGNIVTLLGERDDVPRLLSIADYVLITSDNESFGMVGIEAIAAGKIIVSTPCDGIKEILQNSEEMIAKTNDAKGIYNILISEINDADYRKKSLSTIMSRQNIFTIQAVCKRYIDGYTRLIGENQ